MITFEEASKIAGYDRNARPPEKEVIWYGYKAGAVRKFTSHMDGENTTDNLYGAFSC